MPDSSYFRSQADIFDRVADRCSVLAQDFHARAGDIASGPAPGGASQADNPD